MKGFQFYQDKANEWRWRLRDGNQEIVADSAEGYKQKADCEKGAQLFTTLGPDAPERKVAEFSTAGQGPEWEYFEDTKQEWRWRFQAKNNKVLADGSEGYVSESNVKRAITNVKSLLREIGNSGGSGAGSYVPPVVGGGTTNSGGGRFA